MKPAAIVQILASVFMVLVVAVSLAEAEYLQQSDPLVMPSDDDELQLAAAAAAVKRPFCNAFTGCGRKRSDIEMTEPMSSTDTVGGGSSTDLFLKKLGRHIFRMKSAAAAAADYQNRPWNSYNKQKNQLRTPWLDYMGDRKK